ncbi:MAG: hypothetical protein GXO43_04245 [Crenarchaeota archaeon]|nr:hypothetical protein [Thermoproteota archaeon]
MPTTVSPPKPIPVHHTTTTTPANIVNAIKHVAGTTGFNTTTIVGVILGILLLIAIVSIIAIIIIRKLKGQHKYKATQKLDKALEEGDAVGVTLDLLTHKADFVPLRRVQGYYFSDDPNNFSVIAANPYAELFMVQGKPLVIAPVSGRAGMQIDPIIFTKLGLAQVAIKDPLWKNAMNPHKAMESIVEKLMSNLGQQVGELRLTHNVKLGFEMSPPGIILSLLQVYIQFNEMLMNSAVNFYDTADRISKILKEHKLKEAQVKTKQWMAIIIGLSFMMLVGAIAWYVMHLGHP